MVLYHLKQWASEIQKGPPAFCGPNTATRMLGQSHDWGLLRVLNQTCPKSSGGLRRLSSPLKFKFHGLNQVLTVDFGELAMDLSTATSLFPLMCGDVYRIPFLRIPSLTPQLVGSWYIYRCSLRLFMKCL